MEVFDFFLFLLSFLIYFTLGFEEKFWCSWETDNLFMWLSYENSC